jgi:homogentisate 1,2-dioxygenase
MTIQYQSGFGNEFETEALKGALPKDQNSPQKPPHGLYTEQLSGAPFTVPQNNQLRSWPDFIDGVVTMAKGGDAHSWTGLGVHRYAINASMEKRFFYDADGELLFVLERGGLTFRT